MLVFYFIHNSDAFGVLKAKIILAKSCFAESVESKEVRYINYQKFRSLKVWSILICHFKFWSIFKKFMSFFGQNFGQQGFL